MDDRREQFIIKDDLASFGYQLSEDIRKAKVDIIKWIFFFGITQMIATSVLLILFLKK